jgi:hypothetical protein
VLTRTAVRILVPPARWQKVASWPQPDQTLELRWPQLSTFDLIGGRWRHRGVVLGLGTGERLFLVGTTGDGLLESLAELGLDRKTSA